MNFLGWLLSTMYAPEDQRSLKYDPFVVDASRVELVRNPDGSTAYARSANGALCIQFKYPYTGTIFEVEDK